MTEITTTTRDIRDRAAGLVERGEATNIVLAIDRAVVELNAGHAMYHRVCEELRTELDTDSLSHWRQDRTADETLAALRGPEAGDGC